MSFCTKQVEVAEGNQSSATTKYAFWNIDFKLVFQKQKT